MTGNTACTHYENYLALFADNWENALSPDQDLTFDQVTHFFDTNGISLSEEQKGALHITNRNGKYTSLGLLLSDQCNHTLNLAEFEGIDNCKMTRRAVLKGSLPRVFEESLNFLDPCTIDRNAYPENAVRKTVLNAILQRDYSTKASSLICVYTDRIECVYYTSVQQKNTGSATPTRRNEALCNIFRMIGLDDNDGSSTDTIRKCYEGTGLKPSFNTTSNTLKVILPNLHFEDENKPGKSRERIASAMKLFETRNAIFRRDVEALLSISEIEASILLREMAHLRLIVRVGNGPSSVYVQANRKHR